MRYVLIALALVFVLSSTLYAQYIYPTDPVTGAPDYSRPPVGYTQPQPAYQPRPSMNFYTPPLDTRGPDWSAYERGLRARRLQMENELLERQLRNQ